jgi:hypothetical protein
VRDAGAAEVWNCTGVASVGSGIAVYGIVAIVSIERVITTRTVELLTLSQSLSSVLRTGYESVTRHPLIHLRHNGLVHKRIPRPQHNALSLAARMHTTSLVWIEMALAVGIVGDAAKRVPVQVAG